MNKYKNMNFKWNNTNLLQSNFFRTLILLIKNPSLLLKQIVMKFKSVPKSPVIRRINGIIFEFDFKLDPSIKLMYMDIYEKETIRIMKKFLKKGDTFIDVGANIGYITAIAMGLVSKSGQVHSFEPIPRYYSRLLNLKTNNNEYNLFINQIGIGAQNGISQIHISNVNNIGLNTMINGYLKQESIESTINIQMITLDDYIEKNKIDKISLIKIDIEGYEYFALQGLNNFLKKFTIHPPIICEITPHLYPVLGHTLMDLSNMMIENGYFAKEISNIKCDVDITKLKDIRNIIFIYKG